jgi:hypothetical protein
MHPTNAQLPPKSLSHRPAPSHGPPPNPQGRCADKPPPPPPTSDIPHPTSDLAPLSPDDRARLTLLFRARGDAVCFAALREEDPLDTLTWLAQPHIKPWHDAIQAAHREHEQTETRLALARALKDITRILDLEANSTLRIRAVNAIIRLANAIHRAKPAASSPPKGASDGRQGPRGSASAPLVPALPSLQHPGGVREPADQDSTERSKLDTELRRAHDNAETAAIILTTHLERRAYRDADLKDANAPPGTAPSATLVTPTWPIRSIPPFAHMHPIGPADPAGPDRPPTRPAPSRPAPRRSPKRPNR